MLEIVNSVYPAETIFQRRNSSSSSYSIARWKGRSGLVIQPVATSALCQAMTKLQRRWMALVIPTPGADPEEMDVDAATERDAREKAHAEAITLYGGRAKIVSIEHHLE